jgi:hypothetical protein
VIDREVFRTESVDEALFRNNGFNLEIENDNDEEGTILNPVLSQLLYDFQTGQGQFAPELEY